MDATELESLYHSVQEPAPAVAADESGELASETEDVAGTLRELTGCGVDYAIDTSGVTPMIETALDSLKMETPGPVLGTRADVEEYQREFF